MRFISDTNVSVSGKQYTGRVHAFSIEAAGGKSDGQHDLTVLFQTADLLRPGRSAVVELP